jgi:hypothetical protein
LTQNQSLENPIRLRPTFFYVFSKGYAILSSLSSGLALAFFLGNAPGRQLEGYTFEEPRSKLQGMFYLAAVLRSDRKERCHFMIRSLTPQQATGNALAIAVQ